MGALEPVNYAETNREPDANTAMNADADSCERTDSAPRKWMPHGGSKNALGETCAETFDLSAQSVLDESTLRFNLVGSYQDEDNDNHILAMLQSWCRAGAVVLTDVRCVGTGCCT
jgi:hypothetical protein